MIKATQCIRCGKARVFSKTWSENVGTAHSTYTQSVCPDAVCQKAVEQVLKERHDIAVNRIHESIRRRKENRGKSLLARRATILAKARENSVAGRKLAV